MFLYILDPRLKKQKESKRETSKQKNKRKVREKRGEKNLSFFVYK